MTPAGARIARAVEQVQSYLSRGLAMTAGAWCLAAVLLLLAVVPLAAGSDGWAAGSAGPLLVVLVMLGLVASGTWYWRGRRRRWGSEHRVTRSMDRVAGLEDGAVLGGLELARSAPEGTSPGLRALALDRVSGQLLGDAKSLSGRAGQEIQGRLRRGLILLLAIVPGVLLVAALAPARTLRAWQGLLHPLAVLAEPSLPPITAEPGTVEVPRGRDVRVTVYAPLRDSVLLRWDVTGQVTGSQAIDLSGGTGTAALTEVVAETRYWIEAADGAVTEVHVLTPVDPLFVSNLTVEVTYPPHTGLSAVDYSDDVPPLTVPAGTHLRVRGEGSRAIGKAALLDGEGQQAAAFAVRGAQFEGGWVPALSGTYTWDLSDIAGGTAGAVPGPLHLEVVPDQPPRIAILYPPPDTLLPVDRRQPLVIRTQDDYGVQRVEIVAWRVNVLGEAGASVVRREELGGSGEAVLRPVLDASGWELSPGDQIRYLARATDNHPSGRVAETPEHILRVPRSSEIARSVQEELDQAAQTVEALAEQARQAEERARELAMRNESNGERSERGQPGEVSFAERDDITSALERQGDMLATVDSLQRELAKLREALNDTGLTDAELEERLRGLEQLLGEAASDEAITDQDQLSERLAEMEPGRVAGSSGTDVGRPRAAAGAAGGVGGAVQASRAGPGLQRHGRGGERAGPGAGACCRSDERRGTGAAARRAAGGACRAGAGPPRAA